MKTKMEIGLTGSVGLSKQTIFILGHFYYTRCFTDYGAIDVIDPEIWGNRARYD